MCILYYVIPVSVIVDNNAIMFTHVGSALHCSGSVCVWCRRCTGSHYCKRLDR